MATMKQITEAEASGSVRKIYDEMIAHWGSVPNAYKVLANNPQVLKAAWENRMVQDTNQEVLDILSA